MTFIQHLRELTGACLPKETEDRSRDLLAGLRGLMDHENSKYLIELLEGLHAEDYRALRVADEDTPLANKVRGQAARTDELLTILRGATTTVAIPRRRR